MKDTRTKAEILTELTQAEARATELRLALKSAPEYRDEFRLTHELVTLLRCSYVNRALSCVETGAAEIDGKRPYGNSDVAGDVCDLLGWDRDEEGGWTRVQERAAMVIHEQTPKALQVVLSSGSFEPGVYGRSSATGRYERVGDL